MANFKSKMDVNVKRSNVNAIVKILSKCKNSMK